MLYHIISYVCICACIRLVPIDSKWTLPADAVTAAVASGPVNSSRIAERGRWAWRSLRRCPTQRNLGVGA